MAIATCYALENNEFVVGVYDVSGSPPVGQNYVAASGVYHDPSWTKANLGDVFGATTDGLGNIYLTATAVFPADWNQFLPDTFGPAGSGGVYKISRHSGAISQFASLPNSSQSSLGNITYDPNSDFFYVSNFEDGKIYQLDSDGSTTATFDHGVADTGNAAIAPLGERVWGIEVHQGRLYYSIWGEHKGSPDAVSDANEIWSVGVSTGVFSGVSTLEVSVPALPGKNYSNPVSDISFGPTGTMLLNERSMETDSTNWAHDARQLEYDYSGSWIPGNQFDIGSFGNQTNSAGGGDYDFLPGGQVWSTGDALGLGTAVGAVYGLQGSPTQGGNYLNSVLIDLNGNLTAADKTEIGDVEIPCPVGVNFGNHRAPSGSVHGSKWLDIDRDGIWDDDEPGLAGVTIYVDIDGNGYDPDDPQSQSMEDGMFWIEDVPSGTWTVAEKLPDAPFAGYKDGLVQTFPNGDGTHRVLVEPGGVVENILFGNGPAPTPGIGNSPTGSVHGTKFYDANGDGLQNNGEPGVPDVLIFADLNGNGKFDPPDEPSTRTMADGMFWLEDVPPGEWTIYEVLPDGWVQTFPGAAVATGGFERIRIGDADGFGYLDGQGLLNAVGNPVNNDGFLALSTGDFLPDINQDGITGLPGTADDFDHRTSGELGGASVQGIGFTDMGSSGSQFTDVGLENLNQVGLKFDFFIATNDIQPGSPLYLNVVFGDAPGNVEAVRIQAPSTGFDATRDFFNFPIMASSPATDGLIRSGSLAFSFYDLLEPVVGGFAGRVSVDFANATFAQPVVDFVEISTTPMLENQISPGSTVKVVGRGEVEDVNFGNTPACSAHGLKWEDLNGNGAQDPGEIGLSDVTVYWDQNNNGQLDDEPVTSSMDDGIWWLMGLPPGTHTIREVLPDGSVSTTGPYTVTIEPGCGEGIVVGDLATTFVGNMPGILALSSTGTDIAGFPTTFEIVTPPSLGGISLDNGIIVYEPAENSSGNDLFTYRLVSAAHVSDVATISIDLLADPSGSVESLMPSPLLTGDNDRNGSVEFADFLILSANFGTSGNLEDGDTNGDGSIDFADFLTLSANFGRSLSAANVDGFFNDFV